MPMEYPVPDPLDVEQLFTESKEPDGEVWKDNGTIKGQALGTSFSDSDSATVLQSVIDEIESVLSGESKSAARIVVKDPLNYPDGETQLTSTITITETIVLDFMFNRIQTEANPGIDWQGGAIWNLTMFSSDGAGGQTTSDLIKMTSTGAGIGRKGPSILNYYGGYTQGHGLVLQGFQQRTIENVQFAGVGDQANDKYCLAIFDAPDGSVSSNNFQIRNLQCHGSANSGSLIYMDNPNGGDKPKGVKIIGFDAEDGVDNTNTNSNGIAANVYMTGGKHKIVGMWLRGLQSAIDGLYADFVIGEFQMDNIRIHYDAGVAGNAINKYRGGNMRISNFGISTDGKGITGDLLNSSLALSNGSVVSKAQHAIQGVNDADKVSLSNVSLNGDSADGYADLFPINASLYLSDVELVNDAYQANDGYEGLIIVDDGSWGQSNFKGQTTDANGQIVLDLDGVDGFKYPSEPIVEVSVTDVVEANLTANVLAQYDVDITDDDGDGYYDMVTITFKDDGGNLVGSGDVTADIKVRPQ